MNERTERERRMEVALKRLAGELRVLAERLTVSHRGPDALTKRDASRWAFALAEVAREAVEGHDPAGK